MNVIVPLSPSLHPLSYLSLIAQLHHTPSLISKHKVYGIKGRVTIFHSIYRASDYLLGWSI